ncbi:MAG: hypothetical protein SNH88_04920 [Rikenellaceae bacterium]
MKTLTKTVLSLAALCVVGSASAQMEGVTYGFEAKGTKSTEGLWLAKPLVENGSLAFSEEQAASGTHSLRVEIGKNDGKVFNFRVGDNTKKFNLSKGKHTASFKIYPTDKSPKKFGFALFTGDNPVRVLYNTSDYPAGQWSEVKADFELEADFSDSFYLLLPNWQGEDSGVFYFDDLLVE